MATMKGKGIKKNQIHLYGIFGSFEISKQEDDEHRYKVKYFSCSASHKNSSFSGDSKSLLRELKPMRERIKSSDLRDLSSLLQRDLDDYRVAHSLVPYLKGERSEVGFFPGILVALMPKGFITQETGSSYPVPKSCDTGIDYGGYWSQENFEIEEETVNLGKLSIDPEISDLIVLDGQHRANAFRYVTNTFKDAQEDTVYKPFYEGIDSPEIFNAELPVTIVWFESDKKEIDPTLISRKLFVDVNNNAKTVDVSRRILLEDSTIPSIATSSLYNEMAFHSFDTNELSLLYSNFDGDVLTPMSFFDPEVIQYAFTYFLMSQDYHDDINRNVERDKYNSIISSTDYNRLSNYIESIDDVDIEALLKGDYDVLSEFKNLLEKNITKYFYRVLSEFNYTVGIMNVVCNLEETLYHSEKFILIHQSIWENVICGGEGLYSAYTSLKKNDHSYSSTASKYLKGLDEIESHFFDLLSEAVQGNTVSARKSLATFRSKATITGLFMALSRFTREHVWNDDTITIFLGYLNKFSFEQWVNILTKFKQEIVKELSPKIWTNMRNIFLRLIQVVSEDESEKYFTFDNRTSCPDYIVLRNYINEKTESFINSHDELERLQIDDFKKQLRESAKLHLSTLLEDINLAAIYSDSEVERIVNGLIDNNSRLQEFESDID